MNTNEFIQKYEKKINHYKQLRNDSESICRKTKQSTLEYKNAYRKADEYSNIVSILERVLEDFRKIN